MQIERFNPSKDPLLNQIVDSAQADDRLVGVLLKGFRSWGWAAPDSDYDLALVLSDQAEANLSESQKDELMAKWRSETVEIWITSPGLLAKVVTELPDWQIPGFAKALILLDKRGEVEQSLASIREMPEDKAAAGVHGWSDAYTNSLYRSIKAFRRGDELGARLQAAESLMFLTKALFSLERRWTPYHDRLFDELDSITGWKGPPLAEHFLLLLTDPRPDDQVKLFEGLRSHLQARGVEYPNSKWEQSLRRIGIV